MKIRSWTIDGFGIFHDFSVGEVGDGLTVCYGPNEAGKSTLLAFLRGILFGFPDRRRRELQYEPLRGGRHGGRIELEASDGVYTIVRRAGRTLPASVILPDDSEGTDADLTRLLGGADDELFRSVFAFSLSELQSFTSLSTDGVRERIFSAGVAGAGRSARDAIRELDQRAGELFKPRGRSRAGDFLARLRELDGEIRQAKLRTSEYASVIERELGLERHLEGLGRDAARLRDEAERFQLLIELWPTWDAIRELDRELAATEPGGVAAPASGVRSAAVREQGAELEAVDRGLQLYEEHLAAQIEVERLLERGSQKLEQQLLDLGPGWGEERLQGFDQSIPRRERVREWQRQLEESAAAIDRLEQERVHVAQQREEIATDQQRLEEELRGPEPLDTAVLDGLGRKLRQLRAALSSLSDLENTRHADETARALQERTMRQVESATSWSPSRWLVWGLWLGAGAGLTATGVAMARTSEPPWPALLGGLAAALAAYVIQQLRRQAAARDRDRRQHLEELRSEIEQSEGDLAECDARIQKVQETMRALAADVDLPALPAPLDIEERQNQLAKAREERRAWDHAADHLRDSTVRIGKLETRLEEIDGEIDAARRAGDLLARDWLAWKEQVGIPGELSPQGVADFFDAIRAARETLGALEQTRDRKSQLEASVAAWERRAHRVLAALGQSARPTLEGQALIDTFTGTRRDWLHRAELRRMLRERQTQLRDRLGDDDDAAAIRTELAGGKLDSWRRQAEAVKAALDETTRARDQAVREHQDLHHIRLDLEHSTDLASLELEHATLVAELTTTLREWRELTMARGLIEETLAEFERTRQPAVLAAASELFATVTGGRYHRVVHSPDAGEVVVVDHRGDRKSVETLSRGTAEQLYLCLRLGLASEFALRSAELPLIMDDVLVNFDPERASAMAEVLSQVSERQQILFFTCHPHTRDLLRTRVTGARIIELPGSDRALQMPVA